MKRGTLFLLVIGLIAAPALGDTARFRDQRDTEGPFDIRAIAHGHDGALLTHTIRTHGKWTWRDARCFRNSSKCRAFFRFYFSRKRYSRGYHRYIDVFRWHGKTYATMYRFKPDCYSTIDVCLGATPEEVGEPAVDRPSPRAVRVAFPESWLGPRVRDRYFWRAYVVFWRKRNCPQDSDAWQTATGGYWCWDYAPNIGRPPRAHRL